MRKPEWPGIATAVGALLILTLIAAGSRDDFHLKDWQPLMAAVIALGGAAVVFRGAKLAYVAAMAKVDFDRELHQRNERRKTLGLCLRLDFAVRVLGHEAELLQSAIPERGSGYNKKHVEALCVSLSDHPEALNEAWNNLESFPPWIADALSHIRGNIYDLAQFKLLLGDATGNLNSHDVAAARMNADRLAGLTKKVRVDLKLLIGGLEGEFKPD
jgi:hypothetical protein